MQNTLHPVLREMVMGGIQPISWMTDHNQSTESTDG